MNERVTEGKQVSAEIKHTLEYHGPIPPAAELKRYNEIQHGFADRILKLAENEAEFRHRITQDALTKDFNYKIRGQICALTIAIIALGVAAICAISGNQWAASIIGGLDIVGLISVFIVNKFIPDDPTENS